MTMHHRIALLSLALTSLALTSCSHESKAPSTASHVMNYALYSVPDTNLQSELRLPAQLDAYEEVAIYPRVSGYVETLPVDIGTSVRQGQLLMRLSAPELEQNVIAAHEKYLKAQAAFISTRDSYQRLAHAAQTPGAVSVNDLQTAQLRMQADSATANSERAAWQSMETMKAYENVRAPFSGTITQRNTDIGALVVVGTKNDAKPLLQLQQLSKLRLKLSVPEGYATQLVEGSTLEFHVDALPGEHFHGSISRRSHSLDPKFRSESVEVDVDNTEHMLMPGMYAEVLMPIGGHAKACVVPQAAVVSSTEKKYVIKVVDHHAHHVNVMTGTENNGMIEAFGEIKGGDQILAKGSEDLKEGAVVN